MMDNYFSVLGFKAGWNDMSCLDEEIKPKIDVVFKLLTFCKLRVICNTDTNLALIVIKLHLIIYYISVTL